MKSVKRPIELSTRPRKYPPTIPTNNPIVRLVKVVKIATMNEIREPYKSCASKSRPVPGMSPSG